MNIKKMNIFILHIIWITKLIGYDGRYILTEKQGAFPT
jgi:hypothetical protein